MSKENTMQIVPSYLPTFDGFYGTLYDEENMLYVDSEIGHYEEIHKVNGITYDDLDIDYKLYRKLISNEVVSVSIDLLKEHNLITDIKSTELVSPKFYNYSNDSINCDYYLSEENIKSIQKYLNDNEEQFADYLNDNYTDRSGFWSSYSNNHHDWRIETNEFSDFTINNHYLGSILNFILMNENEEYKTNVWYDVNDNVCLNECISFDIDTFNENNK